MLTIPKKTLTHSAEYTSEVKSKNLELIDGSSIIFEQLAVCRLVGVSR